jgi:tRNA(Ile)-lysidine synthase
MSLVSTLEANNQSWIEDPSNRSENFERVKARQLLAAKPLAGLDSRRLSETAARMRLTREAIDFYEQQWLSDSIQFFESGYALLDRSKLDAAPREVVLRGLTSVLRFASGSPYGTRFEKLERLLAALSNPEFKGQTLNGVQFTATGPDIVIVTRELAAAEKSATLSASGMWDGRYDVEYSESAKEIEVRPLGETGFVHLKKVMEFEEFTQLMGKMPRMAALVLPAFYEQDRLIAVPYLKYTISSLMLPKLKHRWLALNDMNKKKT